MRLGSRVRNLDDVTVRIGDEDLRDTVGPFHRTHGQLLAAGFELGLGGCHITHLKRKMVVQAVLAGGEIGVDEQMEFLVVAEAILGAVELELRTVDFLEAQRFAVEAF